MKDINKIILLGRLGTEPILRYTKNQTPVTQLSIATSRRFLRNDTPQEETQWHRVVVWGKQGEACSKYLKKGDKIYVDGYVKIRSWKDPLEKMHYQAEVYAENISFLSDRKAQQPFSDQRIFPDTDLDSEAGCGPSLGAGVDTNLGLDSSLNSNAGSGSNLVSDMSSERVGTKHLGSGPGFREEGKAFLVPEVSFPGVTL